MIYFYALINLVYSIIVLNLINFELLLNANLVKNQIAKGLKKMHLQDNRKVYLLKKKSLWKNLELDSRL